ncbi:hypothetical protein [Hymenobacter sublimis]|uniref:XRE family transcriptional regulator n=1 Tax=Hymenobacter sublimis TaxID=2933777 RepID=A0ABY4J797_9BACT|nr:hypothetical protein [Hymenobacter sublimis]UPL47614.1 hypothetical protein MWH26_10430 [Hymenobacter sublimis]
MELSKAMVSQVERGVRKLPMAASLPQAALTLAQQATPAEPTPEAADTVALREHLRACQHRAEQMALELSRMPERAAWARRRLASLPTLTAVLAPGRATPPVWLSEFAEEARMELVRSGSTAQALLQARHAAFTAEAAEVARLLTALESSQPAKSTSARGNSAAS